jgi:CHASE2 domain-containing sensor protein
LAFHYLEAEGISAQYTPKGELQLGNVIFKRLRNHTGGYQNVDAWGYQIWLNYRSYHSPLKIASTITLTDVLKGSLKPDDVKDRIVLIGVTAQSAHDYIPTPYSAGHKSYQEMPGVIVQAQMVSQLLSAVKDRRSLLGVWPFWGEALWIWSWSFGGSFLVCRFRSRLYRGLAVGAAMGVLYVLCLGLFTQGYWVPLVPSVLAFVVTSGSLLAYYPSQQKRY